MPPPLRVSPKLPGEPWDKWDDDFLLLSDVFPTGYHATELACVGPGKTVAIFGAGPVGLLAAHSAMLKGASEVYVVDCIPERLAKAQEFGAIPIDFSKSDPVDQILAERKNRQEVQQSARPGEEKRKGVDCVIDAVGYQARDDKAPSREKSTQVLENCLRAVNSTGHLAITVCISPLIQERRTACSKTECFRSESLKYSTSLFRSVAARPQLNGTTNI